MNKSQLIDGVATQASMSKTDAAGAVNALVDTVQKTLKKDDEVSITGFRKFSVTKRPGGTGATPRPGSRPRCGRPRRRSSRWARRCARPSTAGGDDRERSIG